MNCKNCGEPLTGNYCSNCGQKGKTHRITAKHILEEFIEGFFHLHGKLPITILALYKQPGEMLRNYINGKRIPYFNPFSFLLIVSIGLSYFFYTIDTAIITEQNLLASKETVDFTVKHLNIRLIFVVPLYALLGFAFFPKLRYNFTEHFVASAYLCYQSVLTSLIGLVLLRTLSINYLYFVAFTSLYLGYQIYGFAQFYNPNNRLWSWIKVIFIVAIGFILNFVLLNEIFILKNQI